MSSTSVPFKAVVPARYASTRLPGKPLLDLGGKPMVARVAERAAASGAAASSAFFSPPEQAASDSAATLAIISDENEFDFFIVSPSCNPNVHGFCRYTDFACGRNATLTC